MIAPFGLAPVAPFRRCARSALAVAQQSVALISRSPGSMLVLAALHEMEAVRTLLDSALAQLQMTTQSPTLH